MVHTGSAAGDTGPTIILLKGKTKRAMFNDDYLVRKGLNPGSTIITTENESMTHDAWYEGKGRTPSVGTTKMPTIGG